MDLENWRRGENLSPHLPGKIIFDWLVMENEA
jgi:hypothetical protein